MRPVNHRYRTQLASPERGRETASVQLSPVVLLAPVLASLLFAASDVQAAESAWPERPLRIIVAQAVGGPPDLIARFVAEPLGRALGVPVVVENRAGASGIIGVSAAAQAAPDGYTFLIGTLSTHALVPQAGAKVPYDALRDFAPVGNLFRSIKVLWVPAALPVNDINQWMRYVRARPGALNFASGGVGSSNHIDMAIVMSASGLDMVHVPYSGPSAAINAVASGDAQAMIVSVGTGLPLAQSGRIRALAVFSTRRSPQLPDVPTAGEQGFAEFSLSAWIGLLAPAGTPQAVVASVNAELNAILRSKVAIAWADLHGLEIIGGSPTAFGVTMATDYQRWGDIIRRLQLRPE
jgi:tripartite-type tricarboxylate transporter receptor subunit TctC